MEETSFLKWILIILILFLVGILSYSHGQRNKVIEICNEEPNNGCIQEQCKYEHYNSKEFEDDYQTCELIMRGHNTQEKCELFRTTDEYQKVLGDYEEGCIQETKDDLVYWNHKWISKYWLQSKCYD